jgi:hypothetical protein
MPLLVTQNQPLKFAGGGLQGFQSNSYSRQQRAPNTQQL